MRVQSIAVLHQGKEGADNPTIVGALRLRDRLCKALCDLGLSVTPVFLDEQFQWVEALRRSNADLVFNAADLGHSYDIKLEPHIASVLQWIGLPFTGSGCHAGLASGDKYRSKLLLRAMGVHTPGCHLLRDIDPHQMTYPLIIKARYGHNSEGLTDKSVVYSAAQMIAAMAELHTSRTEYIVEEYIDGDEISAGFIGTRDRRVLPFFTIQFGEAFQGRPKILGYNSKWIEDSDEYNNSMPTLFGHPCRLADQMASHLLTIADLFKINDYGRCDFRIRTNPDGSQDACVIDINSNPDINSDAGLFRMAAATGMDYPQFISALLRAAVERYEGLAQ